ncbi:MAG: hypothetical protein ACK2UO_06935 [Caldilineaceae bacterium]
MFSRTHEVQQIVPKVIAVLVNGGKVAVIWILQQVENALLDRGKFPPVTVGHDEACAVTGCNFLGNSRRNTGPVDAEADGSRFSHFSDVRLNGVIEKVGILGLVGAGAYVGRYDYGGSLLELLNGLAGGMTHFGFSVIV